jgi:acyl-coenzyme A synthetase/AMP-(fatty) acid ligase
LPLLQSDGLDGKIGYTPEGPISRRHFLADVAQVAERLPDRPYALNTCRNRYLFIVAFAAVGLRRQTNLLTGAQTAHQLASIGDTFRARYVLTDAELGAWIRHEPADLGDVAMPSIDSKHIIAIPFTSGSTGDAQPHPKRWGELVAGAILARKRFGFDRLPGGAIIATVPPQHMYGLETSVMLPLATRLGAWSGRPFFPEDLRAALAAVSPPRVLVTTPPHLSVCMRAGLSWSPASLVISATAPLAPDLAAAAEQAFGAPVMEIYGFTEAGSIASRRTLRDPFWRLYDTMVIRNNTVIAPHLSAPTPLDDVLEPRGCDLFELMGRKQDLVKVAGKRTSLTHLNHVLNEIAGVDDGVFVMSDSASSDITRLAALVVAPGQSKQALIKALADRIDPAFLPRPLYLVDRLPRDETGKLNRQDVLSLMTALQLGSDRSEG